MCEGVSLDSDWEPVEPQSFSFSKERSVVWVENREHMSYEGAPVTAPPTSRRMMMCRPRHSRARIRQSRLCSGKLRWRSREAAGMLVKERVLQKWSST